MADEADGANDAAERQLQQFIDRQRRSQMTPAQAHPAFCDCKDWVAGRLCGDLLCQQALESVVRMAGLRRPHGAAA